MEQLNSWMLVGNGHIGKELKRQVGQDYVAERLALNPKPNLVFDSKGVTEQQYDDELQGVENVADIPEGHHPDVTFIAVPSDENGFLAKRYIDSALDHGKIAITAEKGSLANHFGYLRDKSNDFETLGINATVGGGTRMLDMLRPYAVDPENITQIHLSLNGTLSYIFSSIAPPNGYGMSLGAAVHQAVEMGYAEPGAEDLNDVIRAEAEGDIPKKTSIIFNRLGLSEDLIDLDQLSFKLTDDHIKKAIEEAKVRRFIVSMYSEGYLDKYDERCPEGDIIPGFNVDHAGWRIVGGFRNIERNPLFDPLATLSGPSAGAVIGLGPNETDGQYSFSGQGAGVRPTVNTMLDDYILRSHLIK